MMKRELAGAQSVSSIGGAFNTLMAWRFVFRFALGIRYSCRLVPRLLRAHLEGTGGRTGHAGGALVTQANNGLHRSASGGHGHGTVSVARRARLSDPAGEDGVR